MSESTHAPGACEEKPAGGRLAVERSSARTIVLAGREFLYFGGCGYLALAHEPRVLAALADGAARLGVSSGAARETTGNVVLHERLEREIAAALELEDALLLPEGACANIALFEALASAPLRVFVDRDAHPTLRKAASNAKRGCADFSHADLSALRAQVAAHSSEVAICSDGVYPSAGRAAAIPQLLDCLPRDRGLLVIDDCHGFGVLGARGRGSLGAAGVRDPRVIVTGTLSKALGTYGGFVAGTRARIAEVRERSELYAGTTPLPPPLAAAALAALSILVNEPERHADFQRGVQRFRAGLRDIGVPLQPLEFPVCAFDLEPARMRRVHEFAREHGVFLPLIRYAGGAEQGFFRIVWNAAHDERDLEQLLGTLAAALRRS